ncbi:MAG: imidazole glycerol phosphate synthase subunit HisH [Candidatus Omnitrophica bacterium]|nr:imidazole glycerol phosphate synthase subunit HisH [Candidatus Omnitrophota bacterium]MDD5352412.1 imidazole glycerol phosphate synthase subunit HisH [Candidatus Omnitrophota bacterium]MDD5550010.1 imidazole glycerol phosphate synthase subunit HisH [Candidatus Omnitrophota bacterium]
MVSIINYGMGNIRSVYNALNFIKVDCRIVNSAAEILESEKLILPGVGSFRMAMDNIKNRGLFDAINEAVLIKKNYILGICLGMQLFADEGEEDGLTKGFGWIPAAAKRFPAQVLGIKIPHIGFNRVYFQGTPVNLFKGLGESADFYFVHSYRMVCLEQEKYSSSWANYGERFIASVQYKNIFGTQFHPEKSLSNGLVVLRNFCQL